MKNEFLVPSGLGVSPEDIAATNQIVREQFPDSTISAAMPPAEDVASPCETACNLAQAAGEAACKRIGNSLGQAFCVAVVRAAGAECRRRCN